LWEYKKGGGEVIGDFGENKRSELKENNRRRRKYRIIGKNN
jgi:hypothetical protein